MRDVVLVPIRLLRPVTAPTGGHWNAGEVAGFEPEVAAGLIARGAAERVPEKAPAAPTKDKMVRGGLKKGG